MVNYSVSDIMHKAIGISTKDKIDARLYDKKAIEKTENPNVECIRNGELIKEFRAELDGKNGGKKVFLLKFYNKFELSEGLWEVDLKIQRIKSSGLPNGLKKYVEWDIVIKPPNTLERTAQELVKYYNTPLLKRILRK